MILNARGHKRTANEFAKELVYSYGEGAYHWQERIIEEYADKATDLEIERVHTAITRQLARVYKLLGSPNPQRNKEDDPDDA